MNECGRRRAASTLRAKPASARGKNDFILGADSQTLTFRECIPKCAAPYTPLVPDGKEPLRDMSLH